MIAESQGTAIRDRFADSLAFHAKGRINAAIASWPVSTPRLNETSGSAMPTELSPTPISFNADAKPRPWKRPNAKVRIQRHCRLFLPTRFSHPTRSEERRVGKECG